MTKDELIERINEIGSMSPMFFLIRANQLFLEFIGDKKLKKIYGEVLQNTIYKEIIE